LFLSTSEKFGFWVLAPAAAEPLLGALDEPDAPLELLPEAPLELLPDALGACDLSAPEAPVDDEPELCATATLARANSAAAVAVLMTFNIGTFLLQEVG
jgi:hypothetical protein